MYVPSWIPGATFQRWAEQARGKYTKMVREPFEKVQCEIVCSTQAPEIISFTDHMKKINSAHSCFVQNRLEDLAVRTPDPRMYENRLMATSASILSAGVDTVRVLVS